MKLTKTNMILLVMAVCPAFQQQAFAQNVVSRSVLGNGGAVLSDSSFGIIGTVGQTIIGVAHDQANVNNVGFWNLPTRLISTEVQEASSSVPKEYRLEQNYPNPFNPTTTIMFVLPQRSKVTLTLFDILGRQVATLVDDEFDTGVHKVVFDATDLANGVYVYRVRAEGYVQSKKLILLK